jgi:hypothetical protein
MHPVAVGSVSLEGPRQYFLGFARANDEAIQQVRGAEWVGGSVEMVIGGQPTSIAAEYTVTLEAATAGALHFLQGGQADPALDWEQM